MSHLKIILELFLKNHINIYLNVILLNSISGAMQHIVIIRVINITI